MSKYAFYRFSLPLACTAALLVAATTPARAEEAATLAALQAQLKELSQQVQALNARVAEQDAVIAAQKSQIVAAPAAAPAAQSWDRTAAAAAPPVSSGGKTPVTLTMGERLRIESADGLYSFEPYGRAHMDAAFFRDDQSDRANNAQMRRARLGFRGKIGEDLAYRMELDFGNEDLNLRDAFLTYSGFDVADLHLGNMKPALGLEQLTSSNDIMFVERAGATNAFTRGHVLGAAATAGGDNWSLRGGVYNEDARVNSTDDEAVSVDLRGTADLLRQSPHVLHVGLGGSWRKPNSTTNSFTFAAAPAGVGSSIVSTGALADVDDALVYGAELAGIFGPLSWQGEYLRADISRGTAPSASLWGAYGQAGWLLTGETRPYDAKNGVFGRVRPENPFSPRNNSWGALEILARYDRLSLNDSGAGVLGGAMDQYAFGFNWYLRNNLRLMANYTIVDTDDNAVVPNDDPDVVHLRAQWDF